MVVRLIPPLGDNIGSMGMRMNKRAYDLVAAMKHRNGR
jgi:hypothetical protein